MANKTAYIAGELGPPIPSMGQMISVLRDAGLQIHVGRFSIRVEDCSHFVFEEYGCDLGAPVISADADSIEELVRDGTLVSNALSLAGVRHRFEIYATGSNDMAAYLHHQWPLVESNDA